MKLFLQVTYYAKDEKQNMDSCILNVDNKKINLFDRNSRNSKTQDLLTKKTTKANNREKHKGEYRDMKVDIIRKFKWYIVGFVLVVIMLSVGLSFCAWDDLSIKSVTANGMTGNYYNERLYKLVEDKYADDNFAIGANGVANIGDIVTFGRYYQNAPIVNGSDMVLPEKTSLRWIIVHKENDILTLLAESVVAFGSFWGTYCYTSSDNSLQGSWMASDVKYHMYNQNYQQSTVRAWLNSVYTLRSDDGTAFSENESGVFKGFLKEAFSPEEQSYMQSKTISGMRGSLNTSLSNAFEHYENYKSVTDKVWLPSCSEIFGNGSIDWNGKSDGKPDTQFKYFIDNDVAMKVSKTTSFASSSASNYTYEGATIASDNWQNSQAEKAVWWWLRSPRPTTWHGVMHVSVFASPVSERSDASRGGVRPAICVPL